MRLRASLLCSILSLTGAATGFGQPTISGFGVGKKADYFQNSTATPVSQAITGDPGGPYHFSADMSGESLNLLNPAPRVRTPLSSQYNLSGDSTDIGYAANYPTKSAMDAEFPNGTYSFSGGTFSLPLSFGTTDAYPAEIPQVSNNTWNAAGNLVVNPLADYTLYFSNFSGYLGGAGGMVTISIASLTGNTVGGGILSDESFAITGIAQQPMLTSYKIPANFLQGNRTYYVELSFVRITNVDISSLPRVGLASFVNTTAFIVTTEPADALPSFTRQPANQTATVGSQIDIISRFTGYPSPTCQWFKNGVPISGATNSTLRIENAQLSDTGKYTEVLTNRAGVVTSNEVTLTVASIQLPAFTSPLKDVNVDAGGRAFFLTNTTGPTPITYQWYFNGQPIAGATMFQLEVLNVQQENVGDYYLVATNAGGSSSTNTVKLGLNPSVGVLAADGGWGISYFIRSDGSLWGTGSDSTSIPNDGSTFHENYPVKIADGVAKVAPGYTHCLFIKTDGTLWAMGNNSDGQLGDGTKTYRKNPVQIASGVVDASSGLAHSLFIKADGSLWAMGRNDDAQLGIDDASDFPTPVLLDQGVVAISAGSSHSLYLKYDGSMWGVGDDYYGQLGDGTLVTRTRPIQVTTGVKMILAGTGYSMFLKQDGKLWAVGANGYGQFGNGTTTYPTVPVMLASEVQSIAGGGDHNLLIKNDSSLWAMGNNVQGQLCDGTKVNRSTPVLVANSVSSAATGASHSLFVQNDGTLWGAGYDYQGQLGNGSQWDPVLTPIKIAHGTITAPSAPSGLAASEAASWGAIRINWNMALACTNYEVWRNTANDSGTAIRIAQNVPLALFFDKSVEPGTTYFYWVKAANPAGASGFSAVTEFTVKAAAASGNDFNGDGKADILWSNTATGDRAMWFMNGTTVTTNAFAGTVPVVWVISGKGDFNGDGMSDIFWTNTATGDRAVWLMNGSTAIGGGYLGAIPVDWAVSGTGDFNGDGKADVLWTNTATGERAMWLMNGSSASGGSSLGVVPLAWVVSGTGDFDGDGKADVLLSNSVTGDKVIWFMNGTTITTNAFAGTVPVAWTVSGTGDFDGNGKSDIFWTNTDTGDRAVWLMNGSAISAGGYLGSIPVAWFVSGTGDFNGDGKSDILWTNNTTGERAMWLMNGITTSGGASLGILPIEWVATY